ncbi:Zn-dependent hydrolase [Leptospira ellinghausenii]|uniref:Zn-dependent hydrolase n=2 Tax=Leptospira ellinghausenii TaxID=1917822 RepID=A0A2P2DGF6_9LEPT|nr:MBL fold metallo-hydrolase [Leptospira ellinghausenii]GBF43714.1 Zn-dependent hydrolase [Leptospira ellinghausenii]
MEKMKENKIELLLRKLTNFTACTIFLSFGTGCVLQSSGDLRYYESFFRHENQNTPIQYGKVRVTFLGTTSILIDDGETQILTDGFFTRPSLWKTAFSKIESDQEIIQSVLDKAKIHRLKGIFVCHSHYDHVMDAPFVAKATNAKLYGSSSTINVGIGAGLNKENLELFQVGKPVKLGKFSITVLESKHTPPFRIFGKTNATDPNFPNILSPLSQPVKAMDYIEGGTFDFLIQHGKHKILIKSSTNFITGAFDQINVDVLFLGIAQLSLQPVSFQETYYNQTVQKLKPSLVVPIHWDNFFLPLAKPLEPNLKLGDDFESNMNILLQRTSKDQIQVQLLQGFESIDLF